MTAILLFPFLTNGDIIRSKLIPEPGSIPFLVKRDIFSPENKGAVKQVATPEKRRIQEQEELAKEEEKKETKYIATVFYEGFLIKQGSLYALINVNGEFYVSKPGDMLPGAIRIKDILEKKIILEIESNEVVIFKKGENNAE